MFPFVTNSVQNIVLQSMSERADELVETITEAEDERGLIQALKDQKHLLFFRVGLIDENLEIIYDSHTKRLIGSLVYEGTKETPLEVLKAIEFGIGFSEEYSALLGQKLVYLAKSFDFQGRRYILRLAFPHEYMQELKRNFEVGLVIFSSIVLILFSAMTGLVVYHFMSPIRQIIRAIKPYQEGKTSLIPEIRIRSFMRDEFSDLAKTFNSLSQRIQEHIETLTHERNEKEAILQSLAEGVLAVDCEMKVSYANAMALGFLDLNRDIVGAAFPKNLHPKCFELLLRCHKEAKLFNDEIEICHHGKTLHVNIVTSPREKQGGAILVLQDKSIHYKILEMRKDFIANASHELKTPITIIRGFAETLQDNPDLDKDIIVNITEKMVSSCTRMTKIIQNLLTLADIENLPRFKLQECSLYDLANTCKDSLLSRYPGAKVEIQANQTDTFEIEADPELLEVALMNLLENAIKYSKDKREVLIAIENQPGFVKIQVKDKGIGIPEQDLEHIFGRFYTVNKAESKKLGGSGLGLSIVETIVEKHFGKVYVESRIGEGSTFTMLLPNDLGAKLCEV
jgi:two-component system, OmpR family, phosphate regulon sensor histidine kinase PhoR